MMKHILDRAEDRRDSHLKQAIAVAGKTLPRSETLTLQRRTRTRANAQRAAHFLRCARQSEQS